MPTEEPAASPSKVFVSYSHDSASHQERTLGLANRLRGDGVDAVIDQYVPSPADGWPLWTDLQIQQADFVLLVCTPVYRRRVERQEEPGKGLGVLWEAKLILNYLYTEDAGEQKFIPILFKDGTPADIPARLSGLTHYSVDGDEGYEDLYRHITRQPKHYKAEIGKLKSLAPKVPQSYPASLADSGDRMTPATLDRRNRLAMLKRVRLDWIDGMLNQSLYRVARIELGLESSPHSVVLPLRAVVQVPDEPATDVPLGANVLDLFDEHGQALLILGSPGAGKTTLLLELAQGLLDRADRDPDHPMPVIFNLSTWALRRKPLAQWLVDELAERSDVPKRLAKEWIQTEQIIPLLDGLDEVALSYRDGCVDAINTFRRDHGLLPIAVCSRIVDYESLGTKLRLRHAIIVQPLARNQVDDYFERAGAALEPLRRAVKDDSYLSELLTTPLMLWVAMLAYRDAPPPLAGGDSIDERTRRLFASFVDAMFRRRSGESRYRKDQTLGWLSWLAAALARQKQTVFYFENLQLNWLSASGRPGVVKAGIIATAVAVASPIVWLGMNGVLLAGGYGLVIWALTSIVAFVSLVVFVGGLISTLVEVRPPERLEFRLSGIRSRLGRALRAGLSVGLLFGFIVSLTAVALLWPIVGRSALNGALILGLVVAPIVATVSGLIASVTAEAVDKRRTPNQGTRNAIRNTLTVLVVAALLGGAVIGMFWAGTFDDLDQDLAITVSVGMIGGALLVLTGGIVGGGLFAIRHAVLRLVLWFSGSAPLNYSAFLDYAVERVFLRKVGGGYIFVHRLLLEYFAESEAVTRRPAGPILRRAAIAMTIYAICVASVLFAFHESPAITFDDVARGGAAAVGSLRQAEAKRQTPARAPDGQNAPAQPAAGARSVETIKHVIVIMLTDRSFDQMLGPLKSVDSRIDGLTGSESNPDGNGNAVTAPAVADIQGYLKPSPDRSFAAVDTQIFGDARGSVRLPTMQGFLKSYLTRSQSPLHAQKIMQAFSPEKIPVLTTLALEFALCDRWFASVPGPPQPNLAFADYGTSFGRVGTAISEYVVGGPWKSIYERLLDRGGSATIYQYDRSTSYPGLLYLAKRRPELYSTLRQFFADTRAGVLPQYSLVVPNVSDDSRDEGKADSATVALSPDEVLIAHVYDALRANESIWLSSMLVITYASHGGFYDHVPPPVVPPDGFVAPPQDTGTGMPFMFDRLGVRVPAVVISPYIARGIVDRTIYEHASIPATVTKLFVGRYDERSPREKQANTFEGLLTLPAPRPKADTVTFDVAR